MQLVYLKFIIQESKSNCLLIHKKIKLEYLDKANGAYSTWLRKKTDWNCIIYSLNI